MWQGGVTMSSLPLDITAEAIAFIGEKLQMAKKYPEISGMLPALYFAFNSRSTTKDGKTTEWCPVNFFDIGWYTAEKMAEHSFDEINLCGEKIYVMADTLNRLAGKTLAVETVNVGYPNPSDKQEQRLRAVDHTPQLAQGN
jgi:hypothetical protein